MHCFSGIFGCSSQGDNNVRDLRASLRPVRDDPRRTGFQIIVSIGGDLDELKRHLPEHPGCADDLRRFWAKFSMIEFEESENLIPVDGKWYVELRSALDEVQRRCLLATYPFNLVLELLDCRWKPTLPASVGCSSSSESAAIDRTYEHWETMVNVRRLLGRSCSAPGYSGNRELWRTIKETTEEWRNAYLLQARAFQFIVAYLTRTWETIEAKHIGLGYSEERVKAQADEKRKALRVAQRAVPIEWRSFPDILIEDRGDDPNVSLETCFNRSKCR